MNENADNVLDLDKIAWESLREAANESNWIPEEYYMNDWVSDCQQFLKTGVGTTDHEFSEFLSILLHWTKRDKGTPRFDNTIDQIVHLAQELQDKIHAKEAS